MTKDPLYLRLNFQAHLHELARAISYGGKRDKEVRGICDDLRSRFGEEKVTAALHELTTRDEESGLTVLSPHTRKLCRGLLGPAPEDDEYARYWSVNKRTPPPEHRPPAPQVEAEAEAEEAKPVKKRGCAR